MKLALLFGLAGLAALSTLAAADSPAPITAVVLYPGSATVTRSAQVLPGMKQLEVTGLPAAFDSQTLRAEADSGIRVGEIVIRDAGRVDAANPAEAALEAKIQALADQQAELDAEAKAADMVRAYLDRLSGDGSADKERSHAAIDAKTLAGLVDTIGRSAGDALAKMQRLAVQKREIGKKIDALQRDLARLRTGGKDSRSLTVSLAVERAGSVRLSYQLNNAGWKPAYRAALDAETSTVVLERLATVSQKTGEDWNGVALRLSTAQPRLSPRAPEPQPWLLSYTPPRPVESGPPLRAMAAAPAPAQALKQARAASADEEARYEPPSFETQGSFATEFAVPTRVSLPADGREISVALTRQTLPVRQRLRVAPRLDKAAILTAEAERPTGVWPAGNMQLFRDGNYVGAIPWNPQATDRFVLSFGRDDLVRVAVDQVKGQSGSGGIFDSHAERRSADVFTLTSSHKTPIDVVVLESSPVSTADEIKVRAKFEPQPTTLAWEKRQGVVAWETTLAPNASARFSVDYVIEYPREGWVSGWR